MRTVERVLDWEEYLQTPETMRPYEIIDGRRADLPAPTGDHQILVGNLHALLHFLIQKRGLGIVLISPFDVVVQRNPVRTRQPDLLVLRKERGGTVQAIWQTPRLEIAPDLIIEIVSPSERTSEIEDKLNDYHHIGVQEAWLIHPQLKTVEVLNRAEEGWHPLRAFREGEAIQSSVLPQLEFPVDEIFENV